MRNRLVWVFGCFLTASAAAVGIGCSDGQGTVDRPSEEPGAGTAESLDGGGQGEKEGPFDLHIELTSAWESGVSRSAYWLVVVRDMTGGELVAYSRPDTSQSVFRLDLAGVLLPGNDYLVAISSESRVSCSPTAPTLFIERIDDVGDDVSLIDHLVDGQGLGGQVKSGQT